MLTSFAAGCSLAQKVTSEPARLQAPKGSGEAAPELVIKAEGLTDAVQKLTATPTLDEVTRTGEILNPIPGEQEVGGHAMCFVGYEDIPGEPDLGGGKFYLRNSWDSYWATHPVLATPGYGTIPYSYIARFGAEAYSID